MPTETKKGRWGFTTLLSAIVVVLTVAAFWFDRHRAMTQWMHHLGLFGVFLSILVIAVFHMTPVPSEGLLLVYLRVYGIFLGTLYNWAGSILASLMVYLFVRALLHRRRNIIDLDCGATKTSTVFSRHSVNAVFQRVERWLEVQSHTRLLFVRLLPIPAFLLNYVLSSMPAVAWWSYLWTAAVSILPYYVAMDCLYAGTLHGQWIGFGAGAVLLCILWLIGSRLGKQQPSRLHIETEVPE